MAALRIKAAQEPSFRAALRKPLGTISRCSLKATGPVAKVSMSTPIKPDRTLKLFFFFY